MTLALLITAATGAWAQGIEPVADPNAITVNTVTKGKQWTFTMPASNVELQVEYEPELTALFKAGNANTIQSDKATVTVTESGATEGTDVTANIGTDNKLTPVYEGQTITLTAAAGYKFKSVEAKKGIVAYPLLSAATTSDQGKVVCAAGHLHDAKTAVPAGCTAVGILGKVTETGHGLILALKDATSQEWNTINGWTSVNTYAGTTLKLLPDDAARGSLTSYTTLGATAVSNWAVAQKSDYEAIFTNLGSETGNANGTTYDGNVNAYITTGIGGTAISGNNWSATEKSSAYAWYFGSGSGAWFDGGKIGSHNVRPVLGF